MIDSKNEWSPLKKVIVGSADYARIPPLDISLRTVSYSHTKNLDEIAREGLFPEKVIQEANEDVDRLAQEFTKLGIEVFRPKNVPTPYYNF